MPDSLENVNNQIVVDLITGCIKTNKVERYVLMNHKVHVLYSTISRKSVNRTGLQKILVVYFIFYSMECCLVRFTISQLLQHPFFSSDEVLDDTPKVVVNIDRVDNNQVPMHIVFEKKESKGAREAIEFIYDLMKDVPDEVAADLVRNSVSVLNVFMYRPLQVHLHRGLNNYKITIKPRPRMKQIPI